MLRKKIFGRGTTTQPTKNEDVWCGVKPDDSSSEEEENAFKYSGDGAIQEDDKAIISSFVEEEKVDEANDQETSDKTSAPTLADNAKLAASETLSSISSIGSALKTRVLQTIDERKLQHQQQKEENIKKEDEKQIDNELVTNLKNKIILLEKQIQEIQKMFEKKYDSKSASNVDLHVLAEELARSHDFISGISQFLSKDIQDHATNLINQSMKDTLNQIREIELKREKVETDFNNTANELEEIIGTKTQEKENLEISIELESERLAQVSRTLENEAKTVENYRATIENYASEKTQLLQEIDTTKKTIDSEIDEFKTKRISEASKAIESEVELIKEQKLKTVNQEVRQEIILDITSGVKQKLSLVFSDLFDGLSEKIGEIVDETLKTKNY